MPEFEEFCSPAYRLETPNAACSRMVNAYLEKVEKGPRAGKLRIRGIPGMRTFTTLPDSPVRAMLRIDGGNRLFAIGGGTVFEVFRDGTFAALTGGIAQSSHPALMVTNGFQIAIASGGLGYLASGGIPVGTVAPLTFTDGTPLRAATIDFLGQYFIAAQIDSKEIFTSDLAPNGQSWDPADTALKEGYPDNISRVFADNEQLWLFGFDTTEVWAPSGGVFPFQRLQGAVLKIGCSAPYSVAGAQGKRFWLWQGAVYSAYGVNPKRISDYGVEQAISTYGNVADAEGWCQLSGGGHLFYVLRFPGANRTWVFDDSTEAWHERLSWSKGQYGAYCGRVYATAFDMDLVGDPQSGAIYELDPNTYTDAMGGILRRQITAPYITDGMRNIRHNNLTLDMDTGIGLAVAEDQPGYDPQVIMRYSDNRGKTWGNERQTSAGKIGEDNRRVIFRQLGSSRIGRTYDVVFTDPCPFSINTAYINAGAPEAGR